MKLLLATVCTLLLTWNSCAIQLAHNTPNRKFLSQTTAEADSSSLAIGEIFRALAQSGAGQDVDPEYVEKLAITLLDLSEETLVMLGDCLDDWKKCVKLSKYLNGVDDEETEDEASNETLDEDEEEDSEPPNENTTEGNLSKFNKCS